MFNKFTERARNVILRAKDEAKRSNHDAIGPEHFLLGLIGDSEGVAAYVLRELGLSPEQIRSEVEKRMQRGSGTAADIPFTPQAKEVLASAMEESRSLGHHYIGDEHLLLGLARESDHVASQALKSLGVKIESVRSHITSLLGAVSTASPVQAQAPELPPELQELADLIQEMRKTRESVILDQDFAQAAELREQERLIRKQVKEIVDHWRQGGQQQKTGGGSV